MQEKKRIIIIILRRRKKEREERVKGKEEKREVPPWNWLKSYAWLCSLRGHQLQLEGKFSKKWLFVACESRGVSCS